MTEAPETTKDNIPAHFYCALSHQIMEDPVVTMQGFTFERCVIEKWLESGNKFCPCSGADMTKKDIMTAKSLRQEIDMWREENPDLDEEKDSIERLKKLVVSPKPKKKRRSFSDLLTGVKV